mmetsp:Transcript_624/g.1123  ORF Transcript_624/g.1123 Transcript_624/m.1123 type:complete len:172 (+) Transcript_624:729-1244(+)
MFSLELIHKVIHHAVVKIFSSQMSISSSCLYLEHTGSVNAQKRDIKRTSTEIVNQHGTILLRLVLLIETVCNSSSGRLVDDTKHVQSRNLSSILGCQSLRIVETCRYCYHRILHFLSKIRFSDFLHLTQNHGRNFFRHECLLFTLIHNFNLWLVVFSTDDLERKMLHISLH